MYTIKRKVVCGQLVDVKVYSYPKGKRSRSVVKVKGRASEVGARYLANASSQVLRCESCGIKISQVEEGSGGRCARC